MKNKTPTKTTAGLPPGMFKTDALYQSHLDQVSRSFAFCIAELGSPLREWVGLSYILCRLADTLEDAQWPERAPQLAALAEMKRFVRSGYSDTELNAWKTSVPASIPEREKNLLGDSGQFFTDLGRLAPGAKSAISETLLAMIDGMAHFCASAPPRSALQINDLRHANQYCFFVAGIVGELLTNLVAECTPEYRPSSTHFVDAVHFGLFLQKINLLKDQMGDEKEGRFLVHSRQAFKKSLEHNAHGSLRYLLSLPTSRRDYRLFCAWSLFLGLSSLPWIERSWEEKSSVKIPRTEAAMLIAKVRFKVDDNEALEKLFAELLGKPEKFESSSGSEIPPWLTAIYHGKLTHRQLAELGL